ncbi:MAG: TCR/Tet family MFS transporter [Pseudomonadota bacterium]
MARKPGKFAIAFIFITVTINMIGLGVVMPVMPKLIMDVTGESLADAAKWGGLFSAVYALMQFIMMPVIGGLSDRFGRRPVLLTSMAAYSLDFLAMAVAPMIGVIVVARIFAGAFAATFSTANAYIADVTPPEKRAENFGLIGAAFGLGFIIGPGIGGYLGGALGPRAPFYFVAALGAANFVFGYFVLPETLKPENRRKFEWARANAFGAFKQFAKYPIMLPVAGVLLLSQLAHWTYPSVWAYYAEEKFLWTEQHIGASLMFVGLTSAIVQGGLTRIVIPRTGERAAALFAFCVTTISYVGFAFVGSGKMVYALIAFSALGGLAAPAIQGIMSRTVPDNVQGELQGAAGAIMSISMILGPFLTTQIFAAFTSPEKPIVIGGVTLSETGAPFYFPGAPFIFSAALEVCAIAMLFWAFTRIRRPREASATPAGQ